MISLPLGCSSRTPHLLLSLRKRCSAFSDEKGQNKKSATDAQRERQDGMGLDLATSPSVSLDARLPVLESFGSEQGDAMLWKGAIKLPMYWVAVIPVLVGAATAYYSTGLFAVARTVHLLVGSMCIIGWLNLSNDVFDHETGVDDKKPESVVNLTGKPALVFHLSLALLVIGLGFLGSAIQTLSAALMLGLAIFCGYLYQGPPFRLSYKGLGEPLCFAAFGPLATPAFYLLLSGGASVTSTCWASSMLVGMTTSLVLFCSHFHQYDSDKAHGKMSPVVRLGGADKALKALSGSIFCFFLLVVAMTAVGLLPSLSLPMSMYPVFMGLRCLQFGKKHIEDLSKLRFLKLYALDLHSAFGIALVLSLTISRKLFSAA